MVMGVEPGYYGSPFQNASLDLMKDLKSKLPEFEGDLAWDGGANGETIPKILSAGATRIAVGSALALSDNPQATFQLFNQLSL
jgi:pentose-5-phosphate-3-epimerase